MIAGRWKLLFVFILLTACGGSDPNNIAPIVLDIDVSVCKLDPSTRYYAGSVGSNFLTIIDLATGEELQLPDSNQRYIQHQQEVYAFFWTAPGVLFLGVNRIHEIAKIPYYEDGWFFDFENQIFTDVLDLPPPERKELIDQTNANIVAEKTSQAPDISPDGRFEAVAGTIIVNNGWPKTGAYEEIIKFPGSADNCYNPWKMDGSGVYIVERTGFGGKGAGPVRFLKLPEEYLTPTSAEEK